MISRAAVLRHQKMISMAGTRSVVGSALSRHCRRALPNCIPPRSPGSLRTTASSAIDWSINSIASDAKVEPDPIQIRQLSPPLESYSLPNEKRTVALQSVVAAAVKRRLLEPAVDIDDHACGFFYDLAAFRCNMAALRSAFPSHWHHATAVKTNPTSAMLKIAQHDGHGLECASISEVIHSLNLGHKGPDVVFDSPCKSIPEIKYALQNQVMLNMDNMQEMQRVKQIVATMSPAQLEGCVIGLRINPLVGSGAVAELSVSTRQSKFGVICPVDESSSDGAAERAAVIKALVENHFVNAVHVHTGSGGMNLSQMAEGAAGAGKLALEVNALRGPDAPQIEVVDIGGGLPVAWGECEEDPTFQDYSNAIREQCPELFDGTSFRRVVTEMGSVMNSRFGFFGSVVEVTKPTDDGQIAMIHAGSEQFMRASYAGHMRGAHPISVYDKDGQTKSDGDSKIMHDIAGPLCFAGDIVAARVSLPEVVVGDIVVLEEAGGNTHSLRTTHCSRRAPPIYGYQAGSDGHDDGLEFTLLSKGGTYIEALAKWD